MALGGRAAEAVVFRRISTGVLQNDNSSFTCNFIYIYICVCDLLLGAEDDLRRVTEMARRQVSLYSCF